MNPANASEVSVVKEVGKKTESRVGEHTGDNIKRTNICS